MHSSRVVESGGEFSVSALALREQLSLHSKRKVSRAVGLGLTGLTVAFLAANAVGELLAPDLMVANTPPIGLPADPAFYRLLGAILALCTALYIFPRTAVLGAVLLTGYLGGPWRFTSGRKVYS
jgi:DoxX-like family